MYKRKNNNWLKHVDFLVLDLVCLLISLPSRMLLGMD